MQALIRSIAQHIGADLVIRHILVGWKWGWVSFFS